MKRKIKLSGREQGQAIVEMCVSLIPILMVMLGMIFVSGLCISNIRAFVTAKATAELNSRSDSAIGEDGNNISCWDYGEDGYPFTADDKRVYFWQTGNESDIGVIAGLMLNENTGSEAIESGEYSFMGVSNLPYPTDNNFAQALPDDLLAAAELVSGEADSDLNSVYTIDSDEFSSDEITSLSTAFSRFLGISIEDTDLREAMREANTVYYPVISTSQ
jgi:hypothetical protein